LAFSTLSKASKYSKLNICFLNFDFIIFFFISLKKPKESDLKIYEIEPLSGFVNISFYKENSKQMSYFLSIVKVKKSRNLGYYFN